MAGQLMEAGHELTVYNRTRSKVEPLRERGARVAASPAGVCGEAGVVVTVVSDDGALRDVVLGRDPKQGEGLLAGLGSGGIHVSMSTVNPRTTRELAETHREAGQVLVAAPVFGRPDFAETARLSVVAAGDEEAISRCEPVFDAVGRQTFTVGKQPEKASLVKVAGNFTISAVIETLGESFALMRKSGIAPETFLEVINRSLYDSPLYETYGSLIAEEDYEPAGFRLDLGLKDNRLVLDASRDAEAPMPLASMIQDHYLSAVAQGWGDRDWAALADLLAERAGCRE